MTAPRSVAVFCGSNSGHNPVYRAEAVRLGRILAEARVTVVFGAGNVGLMGAVASTAMEHGGRVVGVIPNPLLHIETPLQGTMEYHETETMHERKMLMYSRSEAICVLPGGFGTLDETFEVLTWRMIGIFDKPIVLVDINNYWQPFLAMAEKIIEEGFAAEETRNLFTRIVTVDDVLPTLRKILNGHREIDVPPFRTSDESHRKQSKAS